MGVIAGLKTQIRGLVGIARILRMNAGYERGTVLGGCLSLRSGYEAPQ